MRVPGGVGRIPRPAYMGDTGDAEASAASNRLVQERIEG